MTDADEASGEHVQKEAPQELGGGKCHLALLATVGVILPAKGDALLVEGQQAMIGNGHAMGVTAEVAQHLHGTAESGLGIDDPVMAVQAAEEFCELLADRRGQRPDRCTLSLLRRWRRLRPARNLPRKTRLRTLTGKKKG